MALRYKITFVVPENLQKDLQERVIKDNYGLRGKSKWVSEAIQKLLAINNFPELVDYSDEMHGFEKLETVVVDYSIKQLLEDAILQIRKVYPLLEGVKSRVVRTAILQRLIRG
jgi:hypothetical protein